MVRMNDLIFFFSPSLANWLSQGGLNRSAWLFYPSQPFLDSFIYILGGEQPAGSAELRGSSRSQVSALLYHRPSPSVRDITRKSQGANTKVTFGHTAWGTCLHRGDTGGVMGRKGPGGQG